MNKHELKIELDKMNIPSYYYNLDGKGRNDERLCLEKVGDKWEVYYAERGIKTTSELFLTEDKACDYILKEFKLSESLKKEGKIK